MLLYNKNLIFFDPDSYEIIRVLADQRSRPEYMHKFKKLLFFITHEGLYKTALKYFSKRFQDKMESSYILVIAVKNIPNNDETIISLGMQFSRDLPFFTFHKDLTILSDRNSYNNIFKSIVDKLNTQDLINELSVFNPYSELPPPLKLASLVKGSLPVNSNRLEPGFPFKKNISDQEFSGKHVLFLLGAGDYARVYILSVLKKIKKTGVVDNNFLIAEQVKNQYGFSIFSTHFKDMLNVIEKVELPVVVAAGYHNTHLPCAKDVFLANKNARIFIEKPPVTSQAQLSELLKIYNNTKIFIGYNRRHIPWASEIKNQVSNRTSSIFINITIKEVAINKTHWYHWPNQGTRITGNLCHWVDLATFWVKALPVELNLTTGNDADNLVLIIRYDDGSLVNLFVTETGNPLRGVQEYIQIRFDDTTIYVEDFLKMTVDSNGKRQVKHKIRRDKGHKRMYRHFQNAVLNGKSDIYNKRDLIISSTLYLEAADMSVKDEKTRSLDFNKYDLN